MTSDDPTEEQTLKVNFKKDIEPQLKNLSTPREDIKFEDVLSNGSVGEKYLIVAPVFLSLIDNSLN